MNKHYENHQAEDFCNRKDHIDMIAKKVAINTAVGLFLIVVLYLVLPILNPVIASNRTVASNASFLVGIAFIGTGLLKVSKYLGAFDGLKFAFFDMYSSKQFKADQENARTYEEFKTKQRENREQNKRKFLAMLIAGVLYLVFSLLVLYI